MSWGDIILRGINKYRRQILGIWMTYKYNLDGTGARTDE